MTAASDQIDAYFKLASEIHSHFGYVEDYRVIPMQDSRDVYWEIVNERTVWFAETEDALRIGLCWDGKIDDKALSARIKEMEKAAKKDEDGLPPFYSHEIYRQRFLPKWVYEAADYTMVCVDTHCDGNQFLSIFDNAKRRSFAEKKAGL